MSSEDGVVVTARDVPGRGFPTFRGVGTIEGIQVGTLSRVFTIAAALAETGVTSLKQMGVVMKSAQAKLAGRRVDGKALSDRVRAKLS